MKDINTTNEIGKIITDSGIDDYVKKMADLWQSAKKVQTHSAFWSTNKVSFVAVTNFLLIAIKDIVNYVESLPASGADKKATVVNSIAKLYDTVIVDVMPIWLKPFSGMIRSIIVGEVAPAVVDFVADEIAQPTPLPTPATPVVTAQVFGVPGREDLPS